MRPVDYYHSCTVTLEAAVDVEGEIVGTGVKMARMAAAMGSERASVNTARAGSRTRSAW